MNLLKRIHKRAGGSSLGGHFFSDNEDHCPKVRPTVG